MDGRRSEAYSIHKNASKCGWMAKADISYPQYKLKTWMDLPRWYIPSTNKVENVDESGYGSKFFVSLPYGGKFPARAPLKARSLSLRCQILMILVFATNPK